MGEVMGKWGLDGHWLPFEYAEKKKSANGNPMRLPRRRRDVRVFQRSRYGRRYRPSSRWRKISRVFASTRQRPRRREPPPLPGQECQTWRS